MNHVGSELLAVMTPTRDDLVSHVAEGLQLCDRLDNQYLLTPTAYRVPVRIETVAKTDSSNLRLRFGKGQVIFNWERDPDHMRCAEPGKGRTHHAVGRGRLPVDEWVTLTWIIEPDHMRMLVNGEERHAVPGNYTRVVAQAGIGSAFGSRVTVRSFAVTGETAPPQPEAAKPAMHFLFDEGQIAVPEALYEQAVQWYVDHLGVRLEPNSRPNPIHPHLRGTLLQFPAGRGSVSVVTGAFDQEHFRTDWQQAGGVRFCFKASDIVETRRGLTARGVRTSEIFAGPAGRPCFDFYDPAGTRLTAVDAGSSGLPPGVIGMDLPVIRVRDLDGAVEWYRKALGLRAQRRSPSWVLLRGVWRHNTVPEGVLWLRHEPEAEPGGKVNPAARPYFFVDPLHLAKAHRKLERAGVDVAPISGRAFHMYDPEGNRINVYG